MLKLKNQGLKMFRQESNLIVSLSSDIYRRKDYPYPRTTNVFLLLRSAKENKLTYYIAKKLVEQNIVKLTDSQLEHVWNLVRLEEAGLVKMGRTLKELNEILGEDNYILFKTYKAYPSITHDLDILIKDLAEGTRLLKGAGFKPMLREKYKLGFSKPGFLEIDLHEKVSWGSLADILDDNLMWTGDRRAVVEGVEVRLPNHEADIITLIAHTNFQVYQILLGELLYMYRISPEVDWNLTLRETHKHGWLHAFMSTVSIINGLHRTIYGEPSPIEERIPCYSNVSLKFPYVLPLPEILRALKGTGTVNLVKLPSVLITKLWHVNPNLYDATVKVLLTHLGVFFTKYIYY